MLTFAALFASNIGNSFYPKQLMSVRIRLQRHGRKRRPYYYIVVADSRSPRDGRFIERIGTYDPNLNPAHIEIDNDKALEWLKNGAQPSETARRILSYKGVLFRRHLQRGVEKGAITQEQADERYSNWLEQKSRQIQSKVERLTAEADEATKKRLEMEAEVAKKRAEALQAAEKEAQASEEEQPAESAGESEGDAASKEGQ